jgi:hypothetical protein
MPHTMASPVRKVASRGRPRYRCGSDLLADLLGHVDTRMLFRHYRHPVTPTIDVAAEHIERAIKA